MGTMNFRIQGLQRAAFAHLVDQAPDVLRRCGVERIIADSSPGYPDRVTLDDVPAGEALLLLNHVHQPADTPFRASHAIYVLEGASRTYDAVNEVPTLLRSRLLSLRAFDAAGDLLDADVVDGQGVEDLALRLLSTPRVAYVHAHYARPGCYAARIERAG